MRVTETFAAEARTTQRDARFNDTLRRMVDVARMRRIEAAQAPPAS